jgi:CDP-glycerol glycerophosphotransferase
VRPPWLSVVVPVHGVRPYLSGCLDSVLGSPAGPAAGAGQTEIEVIAVDDASPDGCGALLDQRAAADHRLSVIHLDRAGGPGNARNVGLARATGGYVWFVDGDDVLPPGALGAVTARLATERPDLLLIGYQELYPDGSTRPGHGGALLRSAPPGLFSLADAPRTIELTMTAWSKLFRREFLLALGEPFRRGIHEDIPVTCAALLSGRLSTLEYACYSYRRLRPGSFLATTSSAHWSVFDSYADVLDMLRKRVESADPVATPAVQAAMFERAISHYSAILEATGPGFGPARRPGLVPRTERRRFFDRMHADYRRYRPAGFRRPDGPRGVKFWLIEHDAYWAYELLAPANDARVAAREKLRRGRRRSTGSGG